MIHVITPDVARLGKLAFACFPVCRFDNYLFLVGANFERRAIAMTGARRRLGGAAHLDITPRRGTPEPSMSADRSAQAWTAMAV